MSQSKADYSKLSIEQLIAVAKNPIKKKLEKQTGSMIDRFISDEKLSTGTVRIHVAIIYDRYVKWCSYNNRIPVKVKEFSTEFKFYFPKVSNKNGVFYVLSPDGFNISMENQAINKEKYTKKAKGFASGKKKKINKEDPNSTT
jgi:hypothetical protein